MSIRDQLIAAGLWPDTSDIDPEHDLVAVWMITEQLRDMGWRMVLANRNYQGLPEYRVDFYHIAANSNGAGATGYAPTAPQAICRAILELIPYLRKGQQRRSIRPEVSEINEARKGVPSPLSGH
jgi:hypothetical protein